MTQPPEPHRSQSTTSLSRYYNGPVGGIHGGDEEMNDPALDFCNSFWGTGDRGYDVVMARLRGAGRTVEELRAFWKERVAIEEDYAKRLNKLSKFPLGRDEVGDLATSLQNLQSETAAQGSYHLQLSTELRQNVEQPTAEFGNRLGNLKKGLQASVEKAWRNRGLQEGHVGKARERYESDCLKLNSYTANASLVQGKELEKLQSKLDRVRQTIGANEQDFKSFVRVLEQTAQKWEGEWKAFCDHVQDIEEDRLAMTKDIIWAYANAVSQVCVEDDISCERVREKLEQFEPGSDMVNFVKGWGTGDQIPDPPRFINYSAGEAYPSRPTFHVANFRRISSKPPMSASTRAIPASEAKIPDEQVQDPQTNGYGQGNGNGNGSNATRDTNGVSDTLDRLSLRDDPATVKKEDNARSPFGGVALPGMTSGSSQPPPPAPSSASALPAPTKKETMPPPPVPPAMTMPEPRIASRQSNREVNEDDDPMARALADLRRDPPPSGSIRRAASHRRPESVYSNTGSIRGSALGHSQKPASPGPGSVNNNNRLSYQQSPSQNNGPQSQTRNSVDLGLSPPAPGHTSAALAKSMADFERQSSTAPSKRQSTNYSNFANDVVGAHPSSPGPHSRGPSPVMMQPPINPSSPIADEVLSQYHQAFPGERSRPTSRANSISSRRSRGGSFTGPNPPGASQQQQPIQNPTSPGPAARTGFVGIGAGGRSSSPQPPFRSPSPSPVNNPQGVLGPQSLGISLDERGGVAHDSMAEAYRRQYGQQQQQQPPTSVPASAAPQGAYGHQTQSSFSSMKSPGGTSYNNMPSSGASQSGRPLSGYQAPIQGQGQYQQQQPAVQSVYQPPAQAPQQAQQQYYPQYQQQQQQPPHQHPYVPPIMTGAVPGQASAGYQQNGYIPPSAPQPQQSAYAAAPPLQQPQQYGRAPSPSPMHQQQQQQQRSQDYGRQPSPQPYSQQQQQPSRQQIQRSPSPQPGVPPAQATPTGQWSTTGLPVLFYVKALYDYVAQSPAEFDFQAGDIIAVTSTPEDGWWSGELLDEARRLPGRTDFPSNFVCLF